MKTSVEAPPARRAAFLPFSRPTIEDDEIAEVVDSLRSGWLSRRRTRRAVRPNPPISAILATTPQP